MREEKEHDLLFVYSDLIGESHPNTKIGFWFDHSGPSPEAPTHFVKHDILLSANDFFLQPPHEFETPNVLENLKF